MSTSWLRGEIRNAPGISVGGTDEILEIYFNSRSENIYCPTPDEYIVTADVVEKARDLGATIVAYSETWCGATQEGKAYGKKIGVTVMPYKALFAYLRRNGVILGDV